MKYKIKKNLIDEYFDIYQRCQKAVSNNIDKRSEDNINFSICDRSQALSMNISVIFFGHNLWW